jgi:large subunit ribosomal protein L24
MQKIRKGDKVIVIAGRDKGKQSVVISRTSDDYLLLEGVNVVKKHQKPNPSKGVLGGVVEKVMPIHRSNVSLFNSETGKADRVGIQVSGQGIRVRVYKSTGQEVKVQ